MTRGYLKRKELPLKRSVRREIDYDTHVQESHEVHEPNPDFRWFWDHQRQRRDGCNWQDEQQHEDSHVNETCDCLDDEED